MQKSQQKIDKNSSYTKLSTEDLIRVMNGESVEKIKAERINKLFDFLLTEENKEQTES